MRLSTSFAAAALAAAALGITQAHAADVLLSSGPIASAGTQTVSFTSASSGVYGYTFTLGTDDEVITSFNLYDGANIVSPDNLNFAGDGLVSFYASLPANHAYSVKWTASGPTTYHELHVEQGQAFTPAVPEAGTGLLALAGLGVVGLIAGRRQRAQR